jgi:hypothetical protein
MTSSVLTSTRRPVLGVVVIVFSLLAAAFAIVQLVMPPAVGADIWSYPSDPSAFVVGQVFIGIHHLVLALGLFAAWRIGLAGRSMLAAVGGISAALAMALFGVVEFVSGAAANESVTSDFATLLSSLYGVGSIVLAVASIIFGIAILRAHAWTGVTRLTLLVTGIFLIVPLIPAQFGPLWVRYLALAIWSLLYIGLGLGLRRGVKV